ncbi:MAG: sigma-70 family RNA polymerase sigma factor [Oscillospiraceae bacterium]|nr:sigma-70 family RNA polymerase sigma factor [Oscillospiraceae bacterium]
MIELEREQERLVYYITLLKDNQQETVIQRFYFEDRSWSEIAQELHVVTRTVHKIKNRALDRLAAMYAFADRK